MLKCSATHRCNMLVLEAELGGDGGSGGALSEPTQQQALAATAAAAAAAATVAAGQLEPAYAEFRDQVRFWIQRVAVPSIMVVGLFGNLITMIIMTRRRMRSTTNLYLAALAFVDMLYLVLTFLLGLSHYPNMAGQKYYIYWRMRPFLIMFTDACSNTSVWLIVTFTIERYIAVKYPMKGKVWCTEARAKMLIMCVFLFGTLFASPVPFEWKVIERKAPAPASRGDTQLGGGGAAAAANSTTTIIHSNQLDQQLGSQVDADSSFTLALDYTDFGRNETYKTYYYALTAVIFYFVPLFSLMLFNGFLIKSVHQSKRERTKMTAATTTAATANCSDNSSNSKGAAANQLAAAGAALEGQQFEPEPRGALHGRGRKFLESGQVRLRLLLDSVRLAKKKSNNSGNKRADKFGAANLDECGQQMSLPLIAKQEMSAERGKPTKRMSSPENLCTQSSQLAAASKEAGRTSGNSSHLRPVIGDELSEQEEPEEATEFDRRAGGQNVRIHNSYNCDMNESSAQNGDKKFSPAASKSVNRKGGNGNGNGNGNNNDDVDDEIRIDVDSATPPIAAAAAAAASRLSSIQRPRAQTLEILVNSSSSGKKKNNNNDNNNISNYSDVSRGTSNSSINMRTLEGLQLPAAQQVHQRPGYISTSLFSSAAATMTTTAAKRSPNASASSQQAIVAPTSSTQERRITIMLISVVILFLVCQIPSAALLLYTSVRDIQPNTNEQALELAFGNIFNFLMAVNAAGNFILYSFLSKKYRRTFVLLFCSCLGARRIGRAGGAGHALVNQQQHQHSRSNKQLSSNSNQVNRTISVRFDPPTQAGQAQRTSGASLYQQQQHSSGSGSGGSSSASSSAGGSNGNNKPSDRKRPMDTLV